MKNFNKKLDEISLITNLIKKSISNFASARTFLRFLLKKLNRSELINKSYLKIII